MSPATPAAWQLELCAEVLLNSLEQGEAPWSASPNSTRERLDVASCTNGIGLRCAWAYVGVTDMT